MTDTTTEATTWQERWQLWLSQSKAALATIPTAFELVRAADPKGL